MMFCKLYPIVPVLYLIGICTCPYVFRDQKEPNALEKWETSLMGEEKLVHTADKWYKDGYYTKAIYFYTQAIGKKSSKQALYYKLRGYCHAQLRNGDAATADFKEATLLERGKTDSPLPDYRVIFCEADDRYTNQYQLRDVGTSLFNDNQYTDAIYCFDRAIKRDSSVSDAHEKRGLCYRALGNLTMAIDDLRTAKDKGLYDSSRVRLLLRDVLYDAEMYSEAITESLHLENSRIVELADRLCSLGKFQEALRAYTEAILKNASAENYKSRGKCYAKMEDNIVSALQDFDKCAEKDGKGETDYGRVLLSLALLDLGKHEEAEKEMLNLKVSQLIEIGDKLYEDKEVEKSLLYYSKAIEMYPKNSKCYEKRGLYYRKMNKQQEAIKDLTKAAEIESSCENCWIELGELLIEVGELNRAETILKKLNLYAQKGRVKTALATIEKRREEARLEKLKNPQELDSK